MNKNLEEMIKLIKKNLKLSLKNAQPISTEICILVDLFDELKQLEKRIQEIEGDKKN